MFTNNRLQQVILCGVLTGAMFVNESTEDEASIGFTLVTKNKQTGRLETHSLTAFDEHAQTLNTLSRGDWVYIEASIGWHEELRSTLNGERAIELVVSTLKKLEDTDTKVHLHEVYVEGFIAHTEQAGSDSNIARFTLNSVKGIVNKLSERDHSVVATGKLLSQCKELEESAAVRVRGKLLWIDNHAIDDEYQHYRPCVVLAESVTPAGHLNKSVLDERAVHDNIARLIKTYNDSGKKEDIKEEMTKELSRIGLESRAEVLIKTLKNII